MRRLLAPLLAVAMTVGLLSAAPLTASAAPPTATWAGAAGGDTAAVDLKLTALSLANVRLATSQADSGSQRTPNRSTARSANLGAAVAGLGLGVVENVQNAGPAAGTSTDSRRIDATAAGVVSVGALDVTDTASWAGDNTCYTTGPLANASTRTAGVALDPLGLELLTTGASTTTGTTELVASGTSSANGIGYGVRSNANGTIAGVSVLGLDIGVGESSLQTTANASGTSFSYKPGAVTVTNGGTTDTVTPGTADSTTLNLGNLVTATVEVRANALPAPTRTATSITAGVSVVTVAVTVKTAGLTTLTATIDLLPLRSSASVPTGGIDCPAPVPAAPVVTTPADGSRTNDPTPTYSGTGIPGATVNLTVDGTRTANVATVGADGTWTFTPAAALAPGNHTVSATQTRFGTESLASNQNGFVIDVVAPAAPVLTTPANGSVTNDRTPRYTGTAEPLSTVRVYEGTTLVGTGTTNATGNFSILSSQLGVGPHTVVARATDVAGNLSTDSNANTFTIDTTAPPAPVVLQPTNGSTTTDTTPTISGTAEANASVRVSVDGDVVGTTTATATGTWTLESSALGQGQHAATAVATDPAGNTSPTSNTVRFTVDTVAPDAPVITQPADGSSTNDTTPTIVGTAEAGSSVAVSVDGVLVGTATAAGNGRFEVTPTTALAEGAHTTTAVATDAVGNASPVSATVTFTVDTGIPAAPVLTTPANGATVADRTPTYVGSAEPFSTVTVYEGATVVGTGQAAGNGTFSIVSTQLAEGSHTVFVRSADAAGNVSVASNANTFTVDVSAPAAPVVVTPADGSTTNDTTPTVSGTAEPNAAVRVSVDGVVIGTVTADGTTGAWTIEAPVLSETSHTATARATDVAGNVSPVSNTVRFTVDATAPAPPAITSPAQGSVTSDPTPPISGTAEPGSRVDVLVDGVSVGTATTGTNGRFSVTPTTPLTDDLHTATATATDVATNRSLGSVPVTFRVDTTAPAAPVVLVPADLSSTNDTTPDISGTADPGVRVEVFVDGVSVGATTSTPEGAFLVTPATALAEGPHVARAIATDTAGNVSAPSAPVRFTVDVGVPTAPVITTPADGSSTNDTTPVISGTAEAGTTVTVRVDGAVVGTATTTAGGTFSVEPVTPLVVGLHTATAVATDPAGNTSPVSAPVGFAVDTAAPDAPVLTNPADQSSVGTRTPTYTGTAEPRSTVTVYEGTTVVGTGQATAGGTFSIVSTQLDAGQHSVFARSTDAAGNVSVVSNTNTFTIDLQAPAAPVVQTPPDGSVTNDATPTVSGTADPGTSVQVFVDGTSIGTVPADATTGAWTLDAPTALVQGPHTANASASDAAGNVSPISNTVRFRVDTVAPGAPVITAPRNLATVTTATPVISGNAEPGATVVVSLDGNPVGSSVADANGTFSVTPTTPLTNGTYVATAVATDPALNVSPVSQPVSFTVDLSAAAPVLLTPANGSTTADRTPTYTGTAVPNATVVIYEGTVPVGTGASGDDGRFTITSATLAEGPHTVVAQATAPSGTASADSNALTFTVDVTDPQPPVVVYPANNSVINDTTPTITGTAEPYVAVAVFLDGSPTAIGTVPANGNGDWSLTTGVLSQTTHTVRAQATDLAQNTSQPSNVNSFRIDADTPDAPEITSPENNSSVADTTPPISGTAEPGTTVRVFVDGVSVGTDVADADTGAFSVTPTTPLSEAQHTATAVATDAAGNTSLTSTPAVFTVDVSDPAPPVILVPANNSSTNDTTPTISGTSEANASVEVRVDGLVVGTATANGSGAWSLVSTELAEGSHTARAVATDAAGNASTPSNPVTFLIDTANTTVPKITSPADGSFITNPSPAITGTAEKGSRVEVFLGVTSIGTGTADPVTGVFSVTPTAPLVDGTYVATAVSTDAAGNVAPTSEPVRFTIDRVAPAAPVLATPANGSLVNTLTPTYTGTAEALSTVRVYEGATLLGTGTASSTGAFSIASTQLAAGTHAVVARATDAAANVSADSNENTFTIDVTAPGRPTITVPVDESSTNDTTPTISGTADPDVLVEVTVSGVVQPVVRANGDGNFTLSSTLLAPGRYGATAVAIDAAGNRSVVSDRVDFTVDTVLPTTPQITQPVDGSTIKNANPPIRGTAEPGTTVQVFVDGTLVGTDVAADGTGAFTVTPTTALTDALHTATAVSTDAAGNVSPTSQPVRFTVDTAAPAAPVILVPANNSSVGTNTPTISGTAEPNSSVAVYVDAVLVRTTTATETGTWSVVSTGLAEGPHTTRAYATDLATNTSLPSGPVAFTVDTSNTTVPVITSPADGSFITDPSPAIVGTAEKGSRVEVFLGVTSIGFGTADATTGVFSVTPPAPLVDGTYVATAVSTDAAGNVSPTSATVQFTIDRVAPAAPVLATPADGSSVSTRTPTYTGTAEAFSTVRVYEGATLLGTGQASSTGTFSIVSTQLALGSHLVVARATDATANVSADSNQNRFTVDVAAPAEPNITAPLDGSTVSNPSPAITGTAEPGSTVEVFLGGVSIGTGVADLQTGVFSVTRATPLTDGPYVATAVATDAAGNSSGVSDAVRFTVDTAIPTAPQITQPVGGTTVTVSQPPVSGTAEPGSTVEVFLNGNSIGTDVAVDGTFSVTPPTPLPDGGYTATAVATDAGGNVSPTSTPVGFTVDATAPGAPLIQVPGNNSVIKDTTPTISGLAEANATVRVTVDATTVLTTTATAGGTFTIDALELSEGRHFVTAVAVDAAGNVSPVSNRVDFTVDATSPAAPVITAPTNGTTITNPSPTISGTAEKGSRVEVFLGTTSLGVTTADAQTGIFSVAPTAPLVDGTYVATAVSTDAAGNVSPTSTPVTFTVDRVVPAAPVLATPADGSFVNTRTPTYTGTAEAFSTVRVYEGTTLLGTGQASSTGAFSIVSDQLAVGSHLVLARATDAGGNVSVDSNQNRFTVDVAAPAAPVITVPVDESFVSDTTPTISGTAEANASVQVFVDTVSVGTVQASATGAWTLDAPELSANRHSATAYATDAAGNRSTISNTVDFTIDVTAPAAPLITVPTDESFTDDPTPPISGKAEANVSVEVFVDGRSVGITDRGAGTQFLLNSTPLAEGPHTATAVAIDAAGNRSLPSAGIDFTVDSIDPAAPKILTPADGAAIRNPSPAITGTAEVGATVEVFLNGESIGTDVAEDGTFSITPATPLDDGDYTATAVATDATGNESPASGPVDFTVDTVRPTAPVIEEPTDGSTIKDPTPAITGSAEPGATVEVFVDGISVGTDLADDDGDFSVTPTTALEDGDHTITAVATDPAGNVGPASDPVDVTVDATAPAVAITVPTDGQRFRDLTPTFRGTAEVGSTVTLFLDGDELVDEVPVTARGTWEYTPTDELTAAQHMLRATATDEAGNESAQTDEVDFFIVAPPVIVDPDNREVVDPTPTISGTGTPGGNITVVSVGSTPTARAFADGETVGTANVDLNGNWSFDVTVPLDYGTYRVQAQQRFADEAAGAPLDADFDLSNIVTFVVAPAPPVITTPTGGETVDTPTDICGTGQPGSTVVLTDEDGTVLGQATVDQDGDFCVTVTLDDGDHTVTATQTTEGQADQVSEPVDFTVDAGSGGDDGNGDNGSGGNNGNGNNGNGSNGNGNNGNGNGNGLANTGGPSLLIGLAALLLLGAGSATVVVSRRRRRG